ncbi:dolichol-phosphate mannosyltransferase [Thiogranum longum]|uniref:Dolichol-phosphate mannosyltransferase n=1 Tax=Thiogranum longum TaxID=1537524 RepID=A0A4R1HG19_9GAMM|nr:glycosyltransferase family 2 protein [Thiogranum longum]TCK19335.1 dolichol-phosphate mannosyltransferase [Thiogranum longum]
MDLSLVIPVFNEQDNVQPLLDEVCSVLDGRFDYEVIFVDDGSVDATAGRLAALRAACPRLRVLRHARNAGQSAALMTGLLAARAPWVATLDGDGQNDPSDISVLYEAAQADDTLWLVTGWRQQRRDSWIKRLSSRVANTVRAALLGDATPDTGCGLKLVRREACLQLPRFDHMHRFLPALVLRAGGGVCSVPVNHRPRQRGVSKYGLHNRLWAGIVDLLGVMWLRRRPLRPDAREDD